MKTDVVIIGAGASGLMCGIEAGKRSRSVLIIDHAKQPGEKIRISGGGHCNFTNINLHYENYFSSNLHFCKSAIARYTPYNFIYMLNKHGISYYEKENGQMFCKDSSAGIINMLKQECNKTGAQIFLNCKVKEIKPIKERCFHIKTSLGKIESESLVIATGGLSYPALGATDIGHRIAKQFGLAVILPRPALVPLTFNSGDIKLFRELSGISIDSIVSCNKKHFRGNILFTHRGLSGPAILNISLYWNIGDSININLMPDLDIHEIFLTKRQSKIKLSNLLSQYFPDRFSRTFCDAYTESKPLNQYTEKELQKIAHQIHNWKIQPSGTEGFKKAEVTLGGIDTKELSSKTMESKQVSGLYFTGEVVDVTGQLGGYNLHWAWASGYAAGQYV
ncbi:MAG: NAD(P)/FAD-dependent oxidoreductase [Nitrospirota bacterium]